MKGMVRTRKRPLFACVALAFLCAGVASGLFFTSRAHAEPVASTSVYMGALVTSQSEGPGRRGYVNPNFFTPGAIKFAADGSDFSDVTPVPGAPIRGPHGGYDTTSTKCQACHSVHQATVAETRIALTRGMTGCEFCHLGVGPYASAVYVATNGNPTEEGFGKEEDSGAQVASGHRIGFAGPVPASTIEGDVSLMCSTCHMVHGTTPDAWLPADFFDYSLIPELEPFATDKVGYKLLRKNPSSALRGENNLSEQVPVAEDGSVPTENWALVSDATTNTAVVNQFTLSVWCANCHDLTWQPSGVEPKDFSEEASFTVSTETDLTTHLHGGPPGLADSIVGPHTAPMTGVYTGAAQCYTCHRGGLEYEYAGTGDAANRMVLSGILPKPYPDDPHRSHITYPVRVTGDDDSEIERVKCARCHYGFVNYAADQNRFDKVADWPHASAADLFLLGNWSLDGGEPYIDSENPAHNPFVAPLDPPMGTIAPGTSALRAVACGRCHPTQQTDDEPHGVFFLRSYHLGLHTFDFESGTWRWLMRSLEGTEAPYSPVPGP